MAKDPAMLWYWSDWHSGTTLMSRFLKGCYMDVLHAQFNHGHLSLEEIKTCLGSDFGTTWPALQKKFKQDEHGLFFNERLEEEKNKRKAFTDSRRNNRLDKKKEITYDTSYEKHMIHHMENVNENVNSSLGKEGTGEKPFYTPSLIPEPTGEKFPIEDCLAIALRDDRWVKANKTNEAELNEFNAMLERIATYHEVPIEYKRYFGHWKAKGKLDLVKPAATPAHGQSGALQRIKEKYS